MNDDNDFSSSLQLANTFKPGRELPDAHPGSASEETPFSEMTCKYACYTLDEQGNGALESVMNDCLKGLKILVQEKWTSTKEGDTIVTIKYYIPEVKKKAPSENVIHGRRRLKKAMRGE